MPSGNRLTRAAAAASPGPVQAGVGRPLTGRAIDAAHVHGEDGLGNVRLSLGRPPAGGCAPDVLRAVLGRSPPPMTLVGIGPVTNLALALATEPSIARNVDEIVLMGGAAGPGNVTPHAEFNARADPEALAIVLAAGVCVTFVTLDLTAQALVAPGDLEAGGQGGRCLRQAADLLRAIPVQHAGAGDRRPIHDACAVAWLLRPDLFTRRPVSARVVLDGPERGRTIFLPPDPTSTPVGLLQTIDRDAFAALLCERLVSLP